MDSWHCSALTCSRSCIATTDLPCGITVTGSCSHVIFIANTFRVTLMGVKSSGASTGAGS